MKDWFIDIADCCGCGACAQACAHSCISMQANAEGFLEPVVDRTSCVECGLCEMACPVKNSKKREDITPDVYIGRTTDETLLSSCSSGGMASMLSQAMVEQGGVVFGVRFDEQWNAVYDYAETIEQLERFKGSKYVDAVVGDAYKQVKEFLRKGRHVLFIGTPCHVSGLKHYLCKDYENLVTVDIMCHAVPSPLAWQAYLESLTKDRITNVTFRSKAFGWENYGVKIDTKEQTIVHEPNDSNIYMQAFLHGLTVRTSCANCLARGFASGSDIMIGDYWELSKHYPELYDQKGMSVALVFSAKGKAMLKSIQEQAFLKSIPWEAVDAKGMHGTLFRSISLHPNRSAFFALMKKKQNQFAKLVWRNLKEPKTMKEKVVEMMKSLFGESYYQIRKIWKRR